MTGYCSFCGKQRDEVAKLIAGPEAHICDECVYLGVSVLFKEGIPDKRGHFTDENLVAAARELLPHLETDPKDILLKVDLSPADRLRAEADQLEARQAAISRFLKAMEPFRN